MRNVIVVGGGAAGMLAAIAAAEGGSEVHLYEKNERLGKKLFITGKGRCNLTNACEPEEFFGNVCSNPKFLYSSFYGFTNRDAASFFEARGVRLKTERGQRVFPESDRSVDIIDALRRALKKAGVQVHLNTEVKGVEISPAGWEAHDCGPLPARKSETRQAAKRADRDLPGVCGVRLEDGQRIAADAVIVATGGLSYPSTGSTGDGYRFAEDCGHTVTKTCPSLVPFNVREEWVHELQGLSLKNVTLTVRDGKKKLYEDFGEMMFTHFGVTGPLVLTASTAVGEKLRKKELALFLDLKPALTAEQLDARLLREFESGKHKQYKNVVGSLFPAKLTPVMIRLSGIPPEKKAGDITRDEREALGRLIKQLQLTATGLRGYNEAIITRGGVSVKEIDPGTMASKKIKGLYFAGEVLDLDAVTGGFNLQIAWSTGYAAGRAAGMAEKST